MKSPTTIAAAYFAAWATHELDSIMADIAPGCVFVNGMINTTTGAESLRGLFAQYLAGYQAFRFDVLHLALAEDGCTVLNERLDFMWTKEGQHLEIPCAGAVTVRDGKITEIRDYFDFAAVNAQRQKP